MEREVVEAARAWVGWFSGLGCGLGLGFESLCSRA